MDALSEDRSARKQAAAGQTEAFARWAAGLRWTEMPQRARKRFSLVLLDTLAVTLAGSRTEGQRRIRAAWPHPELFALARKSRRRSAAPDALTDRPASGQPDTRREHMRILSVAPVRADAEDHPVELVDPAALALRLLAAGARPGARAGGDR